MTNLSEVYEGGVRTVVSPRQRLVGMSVFVVGALMVVGAIPIATTELGSWLGLDVFEARKLAGILAGLGVPAVFVGIFVVLPANGPTRAAAAIGASLAVFGVVLFTHAYPHQWLTNNAPLAIATSAVYSLGTIITSWCLFVAGATFKTRNDPGGNARIEITDEGKVRIVSSDVGTSGGSSGSTGSIPGFGSVGLFGNDPDGTVPTQTNDETQTQPDDTDDAIVMPEPTSDGGAAVADDPAVEDDVLAAATQRGQPDEYCGNCSHFDYVRVDGDLKPYCGLNNHLLEDMEACEDWRTNN
jgi:hypothetical protein